jgi:hypothetical protein
MLLKVAVEAGKEAFTSVTYFWMFVKVRCMFHTCARFINRLMDW